VFILFQNYYKTYVILSEKAKQTAFELNKRQYAYKMAARKVHSLFGMYQCLILKIK